MGTAFIKLSDDFPQFDRNPYLIFVAKKPVDPKTADVVVKAIRAVQLASAKSIAKPDAVGSAIATKFFPKADPDAIVAALKAMNAGVAEAGKLDAGNIQNLLTLSQGNECGGRQGGRFRRRRRVILERRIRREGPREVMFDRVTLRKQEKRFAARPIRRTRGRPTARQLGDLLVPRKSCFLQIS